MSSYSEKLLINCVRADPGGCMCIIYFLDWKCDMFSLLANTHDPENRFQKLNEIHRRFNHWNCHTDSLTFVARSHHCHQALAMINNATNDSLANWFVLWHLPIQFCWSKHWGYSFSCEMVVEWQICVQPNSIFCHSDGCKKVKKAHCWTIEPLSKFDFGGEETVIKTAEAKTGSWFPSMDKRIGHLWLRSPVLPKLSEKVRNRPRNNFGTVWM